MSNRLIGMRGVIVVNLHFRQVGEGRPCLILHGLFGCGDNWWQIASQLTDFQVFLPDLRNHGHSPWADSFRLQDLVHDIVDFIQQHQLVPCHLLGHSLGGKVLMELALQYPELVADLIILDMAPKAYPPRYQHFFTAIQNLNLSTLSSRSQAQALLEPIIGDRATVQFLLKSLVSNQECPQRVWRWKINWPSLMKDYHEVWQALPTGRHFAGPALFIHGEQSDYLTAADRMLVQEFFPKAEFQTIAAAGHWLHADQPQAVIQALLSRLRRQP